MMARVFATILLALTFAAGAELPSDIVARPVWTEPGINLLGTPSLDGKYLSFVDTQTGDLAVRNLKTGEKRRLTRQASRDSGEFAYFSTISPGSRDVAYAWFNDEGFYDLRVVGLEDGSEPRILYRNAEAGFVQPCAWSPDGKQILTLFFRKDNISQITLVSAADGSMRVLKSLNWVYPKKMDFSPDGRFIVYDSTLEQSSPVRDIFVLSTDGSSEIRLIDDPANDIFPVWTPDGKNILFASDRARTMDLWIIGVAGGKPQGKPRLVKRDLGRFLPLGITREGVFYYGVRAGTTDVYVATLDPESREVIGKPAPVGRRIRGVNTSPRWSPDGRRLAYLSRVGSENFGQEFRDISIYSFKTGEERLVNPRLAYLEQIQWASDGKSLLVSGLDRKSYGGLFQVDVESGEVVPLVRRGSVSARGIEGVWSAGGKGVFYIHDDQEHGSLIRLRNLESGEEKEIYRPSLASSLHHLTLSSDGRWLAFIASDTLREDAEVLLVMPAEGGSRRELAKVRKGGVSGLEWTPDGDFLLLSGSGSLLRVPVNGSQTQQLPLSPSDEGGISLHPDGRRLAFTAGQTKAEVWALEKILLEPNATGGAPVSGQSSRQSAAAAPSQFP